MIELTQDMTERFQPRIVASFNQHQLEEALTWWRENGVVNSGNKNLEDLFNRAFESTQLDERGRPLDEKGRHRLKMAMIVITKVVRGQMEINNLRGEIKIWQLTTDPDNITVKWVNSNPRTHLT